MFSGNRKYIEIQRLSEIDLMMSVQPNLWCLDLSPALRAAASATASAKALRGKVNMKVIAHFRILHLVPGIGPLPLSSFFLALSE